MENLSVSLDDIFASKYLQVRFGRIPSDSYQKLKYYDDRLFFFQPLSEDGEFVWGFCFTDKIHVAEVDEILSSLFFERVWIPEYVHGVPGQTFEHLRNAIEEADRELATTDELIHETIDQNFDMCSILYATLQYLSRSFELRRHVSIHDDSFILVGFVPEKETAALEKKLHELDPNLTVEITAHDSDKRFQAPTKLKNNFIVKPFEMFVDLVGVSKANSSVDYALLEYCIREDLKLKKPRLMAVLNPVKLVIDNYPEGQTEELEIPNNLENPELGSRKVPFGRELYIEREDFMEEPPKKYFRMFPGNEVRLMGAYYVKCTGCEKDADGNVTVVHGTYDPETKSGTGAQVRKVKGTIHWVAASAAKEVECRLYENIVDEEKGKLNEDGSLNLNPNSLTVLPHCYVEPALAEAKAYDSFQFMRNGYFCADCRDSKPGAPVFNRIVSLKSSFKLPGAGK